MTYTLKDRIPSYQISTNSSKLHEKTISHEYLNFQDRRSNQNGNSKRIILT